jgi:hypothetical protein
MGEVSGQGRRAMHGDGVLAARRMAGVQGKPNTENESEGSTGGGSNMRTPGNQQGSALI